MKYTLVFLILFSFASVFAQQDIYHPFDAEKAEAELLDMGKMWTFDDIPFDYFEEKYGFRPTQEWLDHAQKSALQFGGGCSAAFVSEDGLIMTNHHCGRDGMLRVQKEGEDLFKTGFIAGSPEEERQIPGFFVDQLMLIEDVTEEIKTAMAEGATDDEKVRLREQKINEIEKRYAEETGLVSRVVTLYNGGKFSLYGYRRYEDIRLVMAPEFQIASTGWDWDNFTYPRYELDFMFFRAYDENGEPITSGDYFSWGMEGADEGEPIFVIGRPGNTDRLLSHEQLTFFRDVQYPAILSYFNEIYYAYRDMYEKYPERESELLNTVMSVGNTRKVYAGMLAGLNDEYLMARKKDWQEDLREQVNANQELASTYGHVWEGLETSMNEMRGLIDTALTFRIFSFVEPEYFKRAGKILEVAAQLQRPAAERDSAYKGEALEQTIEKIYSADFDEELDRYFLRAHVNYLGEKLGKDHPVYKRLYGGFEGDEAIEYIFKNSAMATGEGITALVNAGPEEIFKLGDPFVWFKKNQRDVLTRVAPKIREVEATTQVLNQLLGEAAFAIYGSKMPPDATSTLRISDGVIEGYEYNGTIAPGKTTYFGMYDRFFSFGGETYPWGLPDRWDEVPAEFDLNTPLNFASTNDIVGGNSGSSLINTKGEVIGLAFDGNMESLPGNFIYLPQKNRTVAVDSKGLITVLKLVYKAEKLVEELETGQMPE